MQKSITGKALSLLIAFAMIITMAVPAFASDGEGGGDGEDAEFALVSVQVGNDSAISAAGLTEYDNSDKASDEKEDRAASDNALLINVGADYADYELAVVGLTTETELVFTFSGDLKADETEAEGGSFALFNEEEGNTTATVKVTDAETPEVFTFEDEDEGEVKVLVYASARVNIELDGGDDDSVTIEYAGKHESNDRTVTLDSAKTSTREFLDFDAEDGDKVSITIGEPEIDAFSEDESDDEPEVTVTVTLGGEALEAEADGTYEFTLTESKVYEVSIEIETADPETTDYTALTAAITAAQTVLNANDYTVSADGSDVVTTAKWVTQAAKTALTNAIAAAQSVVEAATADDSAVSAAATTLNAAITTFNNAKQNGTQAGPEAGGGTDEPEAGGGTDEPEAGGGTGSGSGTGSSSTGSSSSGGGSSYTPLANTPAPVNQATAVQNVKDAVATAKNSPNGAAVRLKNASEVSLSTLKEMAKAAGGTALKVNADSLNADGSVDVRITVDPSKATSGMNLSASTTSAQAQNTQVKFTKHFDNTISTVSLSQKGSFGIPVRVAAKVDKKLDLAKLVFYAYDSATNTYTKIENPQYKVDKNGYVHFTTAVGGDIIISDKPLKKK